MLPRVRHLPCLVLLAFTFIRVDGGVVHLSQVVTVTELEKTDDVRSVAPNNDYMKCLADCLDLSLTKIAQLIDRCHSDVHCWEEALGPKAAACLVSCALTPQRSVVKKPEVTPSNDYMKCLADCLDLSLTKITQLIDRCHSDVHCWEEALGPKAAACLVSCALTPQPSVVKKTKVTPNNDYMKCLADCLDLSLTKIAQLIDRCHSDIHCWEEALGPKAAACLVSCALTRQPSVVKKTKVAPNDDYMKCLADCLDLSLVKIAQLIEKCHSDVHCWEKEVGPKAAACLVQCALRKNGDISNKMFTPSNDYMKCLADCLDLSLTKIAQLIDKCHSDIHCWEEALGPKAAACLVSCALTRQPSVVKKTKVAPNDDYMKCLADCLDLSLVKIAQLIEKCHSDVHCWEKEVGPKAAACLVQCALRKNGDISNNMFTPSNDYMKCLADCLDLSITKIAQLIDRCHSDVHCWEEALGPKAAACLVSCALTRQPSVVKKTKVTPSNDYMKCLADCLDLSLTKIAQLIDRCHSDVHCWEEALGPKAAACLVSCALTRQTSVVKKTKVTPSNDYMKCLADCLDLSLTKIAQLIDRCHSDVHCWEEALGPKAAACLVSCALKRPATKLNALIVSNVKEYDDTTSTELDFPALCLSKCLLSTLGQIQAWYKECHLDWRCWLNKAGPKILQCFTSCFLQKQGIPDAHLLVEQMIIHSHIKIPIAGRHHNANSRQEIRL